SIQTRTQSRVFLEHADFALEYAEIHQQLAAAVAALERRAQAALGTCPAVQGSLNNITAMRGALTEEIERATIAAEKLRELAERIETATGAEVEAINQELQIMYASGLVFTTADISTRKELLSKTIGPRVTELEQRLSAALMSCG